jgi:hypothetical protein
MVDEKRTSARRIMPDDSESKPLPTWQVDLATAPWPQQVRVLFEGRCDINNNGRLRVLSPRLSDDGGNPIPYAIGCREFWSVFAPDDAGTAPPVVVNESSRDRREMLLARLEAYNALLEDAKLLVGDRPREEKIAWCLPWARRADAIVDELRASDQADDAAEMRHLTELENDYRINVAEYLGVLEAFDRVGTGRPELDLEGPWRESQWSAGGMFHCMTNQSASLLPELVVDYPRFSRPTSHARYCLAMFVAWVALVVPSRTHLRRAAEWLLDHPHVTGVVLGCAWTCFLFPRWFGLLIVATVTFAWLYGAFHRRQLTLPTKR